MDRAAEADADTRERPAAPARRRRWLVLLLPFAAFFLIGAGWAVAAPFGGTYDEDSHILRGASTWYGQLRVTPEAASSHSGGYVRVPASLVPPHRGCMLETQAEQSKRPSARCLGTPENSRRLVKVPSSAARYNPLYYVAVSWPMLISPDMTGVVLSRLVSAALAAAAFAAAWVVGWRYRWSAMIPAGILLIATPTEMNLAGAINPNGLEIAAATAFWVALIVLARAPALERQAVRRLVLLAAVAGTPLITMRQMGPLLALVAAGACALVARPGRLRELVRMRPVRWGAAVLTAMALLGVLWSVTSGVLDIGFTQHKHVRWQTVLQNIIVNRSGDWARQIIARFYGAIAPPDWTIYAWYLLVGVALVTGLLVAGRRIALTASGVLVFAAALAVILEMRYYDTSGTTQQGRYYLPIVAGALLLACVVPAFRDRTAARFTMLTVLCTTPVQVLSLALMMSRWQHGYTRGIHALSGKWLPPGGPALPLALMVAGCLVLLVLAVARLRRAGSAVIEPIGELDLVRKGAA